MTESVHTSRAEVAQRPDLFSIPATRARTTQPSTQVQRDPRAPSLEIAYGWHASIFIREGS
jgi:hypothetical protein